MLAVATARTCDTCGLSVDYDLPSGFCPACLLNAVLKTRTDVTAGSRIDEYELLGEVARGGMGIVYRARQRVPSRIVALKMILPTHLNSSGALSRFRAEAEAAASLDHESILPIYAVGESDGAPFYSMKLAEGGALSAKIDNYRGKSREAAALIAKLARAVAFAHEHGILHRDLKPGNVLFDSVGKAYVSDFGLAKWLQRECDLTQTLAILGTPYYMAPEQAKDSRAVAAAADIYSLGAILYHLLTGKPPFSGETPMEVMHRAATQIPRSLRITNRCVPRDLETICLKCLEKEPKARYESAAALADDLDRFRAGRTTLARPVGLTNRAWRWTRRNPLLAGFAASTLALLVLLSIIVPGSRTASRIAPAMKAIAVLPFDHTGADQTGELLATGLHDDILVSLSKIADLKVISRNSVLQHRGPTADPREIGRTLGVDAVLIGALRQDGNRAHVTVELITVADGSQIWANNFDRELTNIFTIQSDLALQIASALRATVLPMEANGIRQQTTHDAQAYLLYVQAHDLFSDPEKPRTKLEKAEQLLQQATDRDPKFALALALSSHVESILADDYDPTPARLEKAKGLAQQALRLEPDLPEAHEAMGRYLWQGQGHVGETDLSGAVREFEIAKRSLPGSAEIYTLLGRVQRQQGKWTEALANLEKAAALDPNTGETWDRLIGTNIYLRRYAVALQAVDREFALWPNSWRCEWLRAWIPRQWKGDLTALDHLRPPPEAERDRYLDLWFITNVALRRFDEAEAIIRSDSRDWLPGVRSDPAPKSLYLAYLYALKNDGVKAQEQLKSALPMVERAVRESPLKASLHMALADVYSRLHRKEEAVREGKRACELLPESKDAIDGADLVAGMALIYMELDEPEQALAFLERSLSIPAGIHVGQLRTSPDWDSLRNDPRFQALLTKYAPRD